LTSGDSPIFDPCLSVEIYSHYSLVGIYGESPQIEAFKGNKI
jgi:hypothetical protein